MQEGMHLHDYIHLGGGLGLHPWHQKCTDMEVLLCLILVSVWSHRLESPTHRENLSSTGTSGGAQAHECIGDALHGTHRQQRVA